MGDLCDIAMGKSPYPVELTGEEEGDDDEFDDDDVDEDPSLGARAQDGSHKRDAVDESDHDDDVKDPSLGASARDGKRY
jgi:hypothetical protein